MKNIQKKPEPRSLTQHRCNIHADYDNYPEKDELRDSLVTEQRGICCYCMQRIKPNSEDMKIEHWHSQDLYSHRQIDYSNLLGACLGGEGQVAKMHHCDTKKGNRDLTYNPANPLHDVEGSLHFLGDGTIESIDAQFDREINTVLNLNQSLLVKNRKAVLEALRQGLIQEKPSNADILRELKKWNGDNGEDLEPFCQVIVYYLRKKVNRMPPKTIK